MTLYGFGTVFERVCAKCEHLESTHGEGGCRNVSGLCTCLAFSFDYPVVSWDTTHHGDEQAARRAVLGAERRTHSVQQWRELMETAPRGMDPGPLGVIAQILAGWQSDLDYLAEYLNSCLREQRIAAQAVGMVQLLCAGIEELAKHGKMEAEIRRNHDADRLAEVRAMRKLHALEDEAAERPVHGWPSFRIDCWSCGERRHSRVKGGSETPRACPKCNGMNIRVSMTIVMYDHEEAR